MIEDRTIVFSCILLILFEGVTSLRDVRLLVHPSTVVTNGTAMLICSRDMQEAPLYSVKWYRGTHEFYRYTPREHPDRMVFGIPGIYVDMNQSNGSQVLLKYMEYALAGDFSCEVTADSPSFVTQIAHKFIDVITPPPHGPLLKADKERYQPGELLHVNCTSYPARPPANLTIYINDEPYRSSETSLHPSDVGLYWASVSVELKVTSELFAGGRLRVGCNATIYDVYNQSAKLDFFTPETDPRPERITLNSGSSTWKSLQSWILLIMMFLLPMIVYGQEFELIETFAGYNYNDDYEQMSDNAFHSLVGG